MIYVKKYYIVCLQFYVTSQQKVKATDSKLFCAISAFKNRNRQGNEYQQLFVRCSGYLLMVCLLFLIGVGDGFLLQFYYFELD